MLHMHIPPAPYPPLVGLRVSNALLWQVVMAAQDYRPNEVPPQYVGPVHSIQERLIPFKK